MANKLILSKKVNFLYGFSIILFLSAIIIVFNSPNKISACNCADNFLWGSKNISLGASCIEKYAPNEFSIYGSATTVSNRAISDGNLQMDLYSYFSSICENSKNSK